MRGQGLISLGLFLGAFVLNLQSVEALMCKAYLSPKTSLNTSISQKFSRTQIDYENVSNAQNLEKHIQATKERMDELGIEYILEGKDFIVNPSQASPLNKFAANVYKRHKILSFYSPQKLAKQECEACVEYTDQSLSLLRLYISDSVVKTGRLSPAELHEWRHLVETTKMTQDTKTKALSGWADVSRTKISNLKRLNIEEYLTYLTESMALKALYKKGEISEKDFNKKIEDNLDFLRSHTLEAIEHLEKIESIFTEIKSHPEIIKQNFKALDYDPRDRSLFSDNLGFLFVPLTGRSDAYRLRFVVGDKDAHFSFLLQDPFYVNKKSRLKKQPYLSLRDFESLLSRAYTQFLDVQIFLYHMYPLVFKNHESTKDYENFVIEYRKALNRYN